MRISTGLPSTWTRYEFVEGTSNKFWEFVVADSAFIAHWGRIGTEGRITIKQFDSPEAAKKEAYSVIQSKRNKGYRKVEEK